MKNTERPQLSKIILILSVFMAVFIGSTPSAMAATAQKKTDSSLSEFLKLNEELLKDISNSKTTATHISAKAKNLVTKGKTLLTDLKNNKKECAAMLTLVLDQAEKMQNLSLAEIEEKFHQGKSLPTSSALCTELKEFVVHPATVVILAKAKSLNKDIRERMTAELDELSVHLDNVKMILEMQKTDEK
jgi:hypothetical protein